MASVGQSSELQSVVALVKTMTNAQLKEILRSRLNFKESPFYTVFQQLTPVVECKVREQTRDSVELRVVLNQDMASRLQADPNLRVMVYCAADTGLNQYTKSDIAFPHQVELKANLDEVKANLRGLKNKPDVEQVVVEPDGRWSNPRVVDASEAGGVTPESDDDDLIEIKELGNTPVKQESLPAASLSLQRTPAQSREPSSTSSVARLSTNKRPATQVIDLTGSDDDNDDGSPVRPPKRPALNLLNRSLPRQEFQSSYNTALANGKAVPRAELVPMAERLAKELSADDKTPDDDEIRETTFFRLESLGYRVGQGLAERFSRDRPRFSDNLDVIKFLCKDLWTILFKKQVDNLKTNHRGVYVLTDNSFRPFARMSMSVRSEAVSMAQAYLWFPCGVIRGALSNLGINTTVQAETGELPGATFQIKTVQPKS
ncbi:Transport protein particle (TRAPP) component [Aspergillus oryzae]|uniref:Transport protein particle (TRAPP) component n=1 Tax=Aspergillus oryzae TaxID=5062 RepID=A0A1S9D9M5_ASPOZ|nr:Transport protein particle (TRAPP) component [Aspergillus oryzae]